MTCWLGFEPFSLASKMKWEFVHFGMAENRHCLHSRWQTQTERQRTKREKKNDQQSYKIQNTDRNWRSNTNGEWIVNKSPQYSRLCLTRKIRTLYICLILCPVCHYSHSPRFYIAYLNEEVGVMHCLFLLQNPPYISVWLIYGRMDVWCALTMVCFSCFILFHSIRNCHFVSFLLCLPFIRFVQNI